LRITASHRYGGLQPLAALAVSVMAVVVAVILMITYRQDLQRIGATRALVETALASEIEAIRRTALAYSHWDAAFEHLHLALDEAWLEQRLGPWLSDASAPRQAFVVDAAGRTVYANRGGEAIERDVFEAFPQGLGRLMEEARATPLGDRVARATLLESDGLPHIVGVSVITPDRPGAYRVGMPERSVLVVSRRLGPALLESIARRAMVDEVRFELGEAAPSVESVVLVDAENRELGALVWRAPRILDAVVPPLALALLSMAGFSLVALGQARRAARAIETSEQRFRDFATAASDWFWETDAEHRIVWMSSAVEGLTGVPAEWHYGKSRLEVMAPDTDPEVREAHRRMLDAREPFRDFEYLRRGPRGDTWIGTSGVPVFDSAGRFQGYRGVARDITERVVAAQRIRHLAQHDALTDLPNRVLLDDRLRQALAAARRAGGSIAVHVLDLDGFKGLNDALGHAAGDALLREVARRLAATVRESDTVARLGGDEFVVVQTDLAGPEAAGVLAERIVTRLGAPYRLEASVWRASASLGIACFPADGEDPGSLLRHADRALYAAKRAGGAGWRFHRPSPQEARAS
jgi:diguanylate cyclase (GGDEF)-like protein/PAS domain S-box-containing protein